MKLLRPPPAFLLYYGSHEEFHNAILDFAPRHRADDFVTVWAQIHGFLGPLNMLKKGFLIAQIAHILELGPTSFVSLMTSVPFGLSFHIDLRPSLMNRVYGHVT